MRAKHIIIALAGGLSVYLALALVFGPSGFSRYSARIDYYNEILDNIDDLEQRENRLLSELESLRTSSERLRLQARELGYYRPGERRIVTGDNPGIEEPPSPGRVVSRSFEYDDPRAAMRLAALVIVGGLLALQLAFESRDRSTAAGLNRNSEQSATQTGDSQEKILYSRRVQTASRE